MHNDAMRQLPEWNDLRVFLTVARVGTISLAGERLEIEHSTVSRRIDRLESKLGAVLFDRRRSGYMLTDAGRRLKALQDELAALEEAWLTHASAIEALTAAPGADVAPAGG